MNLDEVYEKGFTWKSFLALLFATLIIEPAVIYYYLVSGEAMPLSIWMTLLLWIELARLFGLPLKKQEVFIIMAFEWVGVWGSSWFFVNLIKNFYFANSEIAKMLGVIKYVPSFFAPTGEDAIRVQYLRSFIDHSWLMPILILLFTTAISTIANLSLGLLAYNLYGRVYRLAFPWASAQAAVIEVVTERKPTEMRYFLLAIIAGFLYNFFTVLLPYILGVELPSRQPIDLTPIMDSLFSGALAIIPMNLSHFVIGFILPLEVTLAQFTGMVLSYVIGNHVITILNLWPEEAKWRPGYGWQWIYQKSQIYFWISVSIGIGIALSLTPMIIHYRKVAQALKLVISRQARGKMYLYLYLIASLSAVSLIYSLTPGFPIWILFTLIVGWSFIATMLKTHAAGVTIGLDIPYLKELIIYFSGYKETRVWFAPIQVFTGGSMIAQHLKIAEIIRCRTTDYIKAYITAISLGLIMSFIFTSLIWQAAPIPSGAFPYTITGWPVEAVDFWRMQKWLWTGYLFRKDLILYSIIIGNVLYLVFDVLNKSFVPIVLITGILQLPSMTISQLLGSLIGRFLFAKHLGKETWSRVAPYIMMGFLIGDAILRLIMTMLKLASRAMWLLPY